MDSFVENVYHSGLFGEIGPGAEDEFSTSEALSDPQWAVALLTPAAEQMEQLWRRIAAG